MGQDFFDKQYRPHTRPHISVSPDIRSIPKINYIIPVAGNRSVKQLLFKRALLRRQTHLCSKQKIHYSTYFTTSINESPSMIKGRVHFLTWLFYNVSSEVKLDF